MEKIVLATRNQGKKRELEILLADLPIQVVTLADYPNLGEILENGKTFTENAFIKALATQGATGEWSLADDSGLEVDALNGAPGIYSARFSGPEQDDAANNALLLEKLEGLPLEKRTARFRCVMALVSPSGEQLSREGVLEGHIAFAPAGREGFGYDPLFIPEGDTRTLAQYTMEEKNRISHRSRALMDMYPVLMQRMKGASHE